MDKNCIVSAVTQQWHSPIASAVECNGETVSCVQDAVSREWLRSCRNWMVSQLYTIGIPQPAGVLQYNGETFSCVCRMLWVERIFGRAQRALQT